MPKIKNRILILGAGKIGSLISCLLAQTDDYDVYLADIDLSYAKNLFSQLNKTSLTFVELDASDETALIAYLNAHSVTTLISGLPYYCTRQVASVAAQCGCHYFDLSEDVEVTRFVTEISQGKNSAFVPQCGLAPGFISIATHDLMKKFDRVESVKMRVGALPINPSNALKYSLTWSTDGLINEYGNLCFGIENGSMTSLQPLEGYETITIDGLQYEAFNTSGGLGSLAHSYVDQVYSMNYKTMRYPGHCEKIKFLMNDLKLNRDRKILKQILENSIPKTNSDVVVIYISVSGYRNKQFYEDNYVNKIYPQEIGGYQWSAIQVTTASAISAVVDLVLQAPDKYHGLIKQEDIGLADFMKNRFGSYYSE